MLRTCLVCEKGFYPPDKHMLHCSPSCWKARDSQHDRRFIVESAQENRAWVLWKERRRAYQRSYQQRRRAEDPLRYLITAARARTKGTDIPFAITTKDIEWPPDDRCPILGIPLQVRSGYRGAWDNSPTLDRIDPKLGYIPGNVVIVSHRANRIKNDGSLEEHQAVVRFLRKQRRS